MHCEWSTACHNVQSCQTCKRNLVLEGLLPAESKLQVKKDLDSMQGIYGRPYVADLDACSYCVQEPSQDPLICDLFVAPAVGSVCFPRIQEKPSVIPDPRTPSAELMFGHVNRQCTIQTEI